MPAASRALNDETCPRLACSLWTEVAPLRVQRRDSNQTSPKAPVVRITIRSWQCIRPTSTRDRASYLCCGFVRLRGAFETLDVATERRSGRTCVRFPTFSTNGSCTLGLNSATVPVGVGAGRAGKADLAGSTGAFVSIGILKDGRTCACPGASSWCAGVIPSACAGASDSCAGDVEAVGTGSTVRSDRE